MKRSFILGAALLSCSLLAGCSSETHEGLISDTITLIEQAGSDVSTIKNQVNDAVKKLEDGKAKTLELKDAVKAADALKKTGEKAQEIKRRIEYAREKVTDEERKIYANHQKSRLNDAFKNLLKLREELRKSLDAAEKTSGENYKTAVNDLRKKIEDAQSPFESLSRQ